MSTAKAVERSKCERKALSHSLICTRPQVADGSKCDMNIVIITGASSGLGWEFAKQIDSNLSTSIDEIWLIARRMGRLEELSRNLRKKTKLIKMDITNELYMQQFKEMLSNEKPVVKMLINCAGFGLLGHFNVNSLEEQLGMLDVNCTALTKMTYYVIPYMKKGSRMIQLASSAAFLPQPNFAIYAATKSYVLSFSYALGEELRDRGIVVTAVCPGPIKTEFFEIAEKYGANLAVKKLSMVESPGVVRAALKASARRRSISVYSPFIKSFHVLTKLLPVKLVLMLLRTIK